MSDDDSRNKKTPEQIRKDIKFIMRVLENTDDRERLEYEFSEEILRLDTVQAELKEILQVAINTLEFYTDSKNISFNKNQQLIEGQQEELSSRGFTSKTVNNPECFGLKAKITLGIVKNRLDRL